MQKVKIPSLKVFNNKKVTFKKRAFFLSSEKVKASMALEGSLVLPIFLFFIVTVLFSLEVVRLQSQVQEALHQIGNINGFLEYQVKYAEGVRENSSVQIRKYLRMQAVPCIYVQGEERGVLLQDLSVPEDGKIEYKVSYGIKPFISWIPIGDITVNDRFFGHGWTGYVNMEVNGKENGQEDYVYITHTGSRYHLSCDCTYLRVKIQALDYSQINDMRNTSGGKYYACSKCRPLNGGIVYITSDGSSFHGQADCSSLKRTVYMVPLSEVTEYGPCSKCGG